MTTRVRDYQYYDIAVSICSECYRRVDGKILLQDGKAFLVKRCPRHGTQKVLIADDEEYYRRSRELFLKPSEMPARFQTEIKHGCPYDCGLCPDHEQHSCLTLLEICDECNLECPTCYASSGPAHGRFLSLERIEGMLDALVASEGEPDIVQISGGEPTLHPNFFAILDAAKRRPIRHVMVNTNGVRIANDPSFSARLAEYMPGFEVYLQFDSFERDALLELRGCDLREVRSKALENLNAHGISTTLVATLKRGLNDRELGHIIRYALEQPAVRGVTFQPIQDAGRTGGFDPASDRLTLTEVRRRILEQSDVFRAEDILPVPCHPDCISMAYALKRAGKVVPLTGLISPDALIEGAGNTITFEREPGLRENLFRSLSLGHSPTSGATQLKQLLCCLPTVELPDGLGYENVFRVLILQFLDAHNFDLRSVKKTCVHIVHPEDDRIIPLDTYNLFYRNGLEEERLQGLREITRA